MGNRLGAGGGNLAMPWKDTCSVDERVKFVSEVMRDERTFAEVCRDYGVSRRIGYKWLDRYEQGGPAALEDASRAPKSNPNAVSPAVIEVLLEARRDHPTWGPRKLIAWLSARSSKLKLPAPSTVGDILKRYGLVQPRRRRRSTPPSTKPFEQCNADNDLWCADFKGHFLLGDGRQRCHPLTITDSYSRFLLRCEALKRPTLAYSKLVFVSAFREFGLPAALRTDNGAPFASVGAGGLSALSVWWVKLGIVPERITPGSPQENGRHERMHRTLEEAVSPPKGSFKAQQKAFVQFRRVFNEERPHEALDNKTPASMYRPSSRACPRNLLDPESPDYSADYEVRRPDHVGVVRWNGTKLYVASALAGENVGFAEVSDGLWKVYFGPVELGIVDDSRLELGLIRPRRGRCMKRAQP